MSMPLPRRAATSAEPGRKAHRKRLRRRALIACGGAAAVFGLSTAPPAGAELCARYGVSTNGTEPSMQTVYCDPDFHPIGTRYYDDYTRLGPVIVHLYLGFPFVV